MSNIAACYLLDKETRHSCDLEKAVIEPRAPLSIVERDASMPKCPYNPLISLRPAKNVLSIWGGGLFDFSREF